MDIKLQKKPWLVRHKYYVAGGVLFVALAVYTLVLQCSPARQRVSAESLGITEVGEADFLEYVEQEGVVQPMLALKVNSRVGGYVERIVVEEGARVEQGDTILLLSNPELIEEGSKTLYNAYLGKTEDILDAYDVTSLVVYAMQDKGEEYITSIERRDYVSTRAEKAGANFLALNIVSEEAVDEMIKTLSSYGVDRAKYDSFGYNYENVKKLARNTVITYSNRLEYELSELEKKYAAGGFASEEEYKAAAEKTNADLIKAISGSLLDSLPSEVSDALEDIGQADLYTLIVGSIFYKLAGLLLPIIYMIMASNNLISGQVDSGSMAYVLSTSIKRKTVAFTQAVYLVGSLLAMFLLTTATGCVCLAIVGTDIGLTYGKLLLLNLGAFLVLFALSGLNFFTSCYFDRSKRSMAIGGGLSIFALVAAMLGLFGSPVIPKVVRLDSLNYFNYTTIISMFDVVSIMDGTAVFSWKFAILAVLGLIGLIAGSLKFTKKDLPL